MTTLTLEWKVAVYETHRVVIDPDTDTLPVGIETLTEQALVARQQGEVAPDTALEEFLRAVELEGRTARHTAEESVGHQVLTEVVATTAKPKRKPRVSPTPRRKN